MDKESFEQIAMAAAYTNSKALELIKRLEKEVAIYKSDFESNIESIGATIREAKEKFAIIDLSQVPTEELIRELKKRKESECTN